MGIVFTYTRVTGDFVFYTLGANRCVAVRQADREGGGGGPVGGVDGAAAGPGDVVGGKVAGVADVVIAQIPLAAVAAVVAAGDRVD